MQTQQHKQALACPGKDCVAALAKVLKGSDDSSCRKAAAASLRDVSQRAAEASDRAVANLALIVADAAETSKTAPAPAPAPPKKDGAKEPVPDDPVKRARSTVDAALHLLDASVAVWKLPSRGQRRVDGVGRLRCGFHAGWSRRPRAI